MKKIMILTAFFMIGFLFNSQAQTATPEITETQQVQKNKIKQGVHSGELTRKEAKGLKRQQHRIKNTKKCAKADGVVTKRERKKIRKQQKKADKNIYKQKHDGQSRC